jgi:hypothetical protein
VFASRSDLSPDSQTFPLLSGAGRRIQEEQGPTFGTRKIKQQRPSCAERFASRDFAMGVRFRALRIALQKHPAR